MLKRRERHIRGEQQLNARTIAGQSETVVRVKERAFQHLLDGLQGLCVFLLCLFDLGEAAAASVQLGLRLEAQTSL